MEITLYPNNRWKDVIFHSLIWSLYAILSYQINRLFLEDIRIVESLLVTGIIILFFYWFVWALNLALKKKTRVYGILLLAGSYFGLYYISYFLIYLVFPASGVRLFEEGIDFNQREFLQNYYKVLFTVSVYVFLYFVVFRNRDLAKKRELDLIEKGQLQEELNRYRAQFLTAQIYPHFVKNTFQGLVAEALLRKDDKAVTTITLLSELMDYTTKQVNAVNPLVYVKREIHQLEKLLTLIRLKYPGIEIIDYRPASFYRGEKIPSLTLLTFVENVIKYGDISAADPLEIGVESTPRHLVFYCKNRTKRNLDSIPSTGIGLKNVSQRLDLHMPSQFELTIIEDDQYFEVTLKIKTENEN